ncbi:MAG: hypothetical protein OXU20_00830 [Myxococcales bacterium]|nr:hypothetical protein [Myxococcales bacterium]MDD9970151.1 hypothetical protein [Myxococcales bacterium]
MAEPAREGVSKWVELEVPWQCLDGNDLPVLAWQAPPMAVFTLDVDPDGAHEAQHVRTRQVFRGAGDTGDGLRLAGYLFPTKLLSQGRTVATAKVAFRMWAYRCLRGSQKRALGQALRDQKSIVVDVGIGAAGDQRRIAVRLKRVRPTYEGKPWFARCLEYLRIIVLMLTGRKGQEEQTKALTPGPRRG